MNFSESGPFKQQNDFVLRVESRLTPGRQAPILDPEQQSYYQMVTLWYDCEILDLSQIFLQKRLRL